MWMRWQHSDEEPVIGNEPAETFVGAVLLPLGWSDKKRGEEEEYARTAQHLAMSLIHRARLQGHGFR